MPFRVVPFRVVPFRVVPFRVVPFRVVPQQIVSGKFDKARPYKTNFTFGSTESYHLPRAHCQVRYDWLEFDMDIIRSCGAEPTRNQLLRHGTARHGTARHGTARHGTARHDTTRHDTARHIKQP